MNEQQKPFTIKPSLGKCENCGRANCELVLNNNPVLPNQPHICYNCIAAKLDSSNIEHADLFCRTYNIPFYPDLWMELSKSYSGAALFKEYSIAVLSDAANQPNLLYSSSTADLWKKVNTEWTKVKTFTQILNRIEPIKESYITRSKLKWGDQYTFDELIQLDSLYTRTLKANNIVNPLQKSAVKTLCQIQISINEAIKVQDTKALKDLSTSYSTFAKEADLEGMINETKTDDITTVAELYDYMEKQDFQFKFYDGFDRDEVDRTIKDLQSTNRRLILESTGLTNLLEDMKRNYERHEEEQADSEATSSTSLQDLLDFNPEDIQVDQESDSDIEEMDFSAEQGKEGGDSTDVV